MKNYKALERHYLEGNFYINELTKNDYMKDYELWLIKDNERKFISSLTEEEFIKMVKNQVTERDYKTVKSLKEKKFRTRCKEYYELMEKERLTELHFDTYEFNEDDVINHNLIIIKLLNDRLDYNLQMIEELENFEDITNEDIEEIQENMEENKNIVLQYLDLNKSIDMCLSQLRYQQYENNVKENHLIKYGYWY